MLFIASFIASLIIALLIVSLFINSPTYIRPIVQNYFISKYPNSNFFFLGSWGGPWCHRKRTFMISVVPIKIKNGKFKKYPISDSKIVEWKTIPRNSKIPRIVSFGKKKYEVCGVKIRNSKEYPQYNSQVSQLH